MCPFCLSTIALVAAGLATTGGATALATKLIHARKQPANERTTIIHAKEK
jgi:hypothetical protein